jgi:magnesium-transporting ATPase (P-type)
MFSNPAVFVELGGLYGLSYRLRSSLDHGLKEDEKEDDYKLRKELYGTNELPLPPVSPLWQHALEALSDPMLIILIIAGIVSVITGMFQASFFVFQIFSLYSPFFCSRPCLFLINATPFNG